MMHPSTSVHTSHSTTGSDHIVVDIQRETHVYIEDEEGTDSKLDIEGPGPWDHLETALDLKGGGLVPILERKFTIRPAPNIPSTPAQVLYVVS